MARQLDWKIVKFLGLNCENETKLHVSPVVHQICSNNSIMVKKYIINGRIPTVVQEHYLFLDPLLINLVSTAENFPSH